MKKDLEDVGPKGLVIIKFDYRGKHFEDKDSSLQLSEMTPELIRVALNKAPAKYAYWSRVASTLSKDIREKKDDLSFWLASKWSRMSRELPPKSSATAIEMNIKLEFATEYKAKLKEISELQYAEDQVSTLVKAYEMQSRTLQTVGSLFRAEMELSRD